MPDSIEPVAYDVRGVARLLGCSPRHVWACNEKQRMPQPIRLGRAVRWSREELLAWVAAGAPARNAWEAMKAAKGGPTR